MNGTEWVEKDNMEAERASIGVQGAQQNQKNHRKLN